MRRIAALAMLALGLVAGPARATGVSCGDVTHHGYFATGIVAHVIDCTTAHHIVRHVIDHGTPGLYGYACSHSFLPHNVTEWSCSRVVHGEKHGVKFGVRPAG